MKTTMFTKALVAGLAAGSVVFGQAPPADAAPAPGDQWSPSGALDRMLLKKPRTTEIAVITDITMVAINSGSQTGREWSACQITTVNNRVVTNTTMSRQCSVKYLVFLLNSRLFS